MSPIPPTESRTLLAVGARRREAGRPDRGEIVQTLRRLGGEGGGLVALFDARAIAGERHLLSAWAHLGRARARGEERLRDRGAEFALFVAGDDQLPKALGKVGVAADTDRFVLVVERPRTIADTLAAFGLEEDATAYPVGPTARTLERLGISAEEHGSVPPSAWEGLVLERIALVELAGAHAAPARSTPKH